MQQCERESHSERVQINETATKSKMYGEYSCSLPTQTLNTQKICSIRVEFVFKGEEEEEEAEEQQRVTQ